MHYYQDSYRWTYKSSTDNYAFINKIGAGWRFFYGRMISFLLAWLIIIFLGVLLTCYSLLEPPLSHSSIFAAVEDGGSYSSSCQLWNAVCDKVFQCTEHSADRNSSSVLPGLWPHTARRSTHLLQEFCWEVFNHHLPYSPDLAPSDFHLLLHLKKFLSSQCQRFQNNREVGMSVAQWFQSQAADFYDTGYKSWSHSMTKVSIT